MNNDDQDRELTPYEREQEAREAHGDFLRDEMRDRQWEEEFKRKLDAKLAATTDEQLRSELQAAGVDFTTPAERPTPITDALIETDAHKCSGEWVDENAYHRMALNSRNLERQLADARQQRDRLDEALRKLYMDDHLTSNAYRIIEEAIPGIERRAI